jgi:shikimate kinase
MHLFELFNLMEGPKDKYIFKSIFVVGPPGSGKSTIIRELGLLNEGMKLVDIDETVVRLRKIKRENNVDFGDVDFMSFRQKRLWTENYLGLVIAKSGFNTNRVLNINSDLIKIGYDTFMLYVDVEKEVAYKRITHRPIVSKYESDKNRTIDPEYFNKAYDRTKESIETFQNNFGDNFAVVTNNADLFESSPGVILDKSFREARKKIIKFLSQPLSTVAKTTISKNIS